MADTFLRRDRCFAHGGVQVLGLRKNCERRIEAGRRIRLDEKAGIRIERRGMKLYKNLFKFKTILINSTIDRSSLQSEKIRTIIKARGITYPNVTGRTFAVFRVDRKHHLMSLVSMIGKTINFIPESSHDDRIRIE